MPARARKRKLKRRKPSSRKKARRRRPPSRPRVNPPSSDEDFVLDGNGDESSSGSTEQDDNEEDEDTEEEEEEEEEEESEDEEENSRNQVWNSDAANVGFSARRRRQPTRARSGLVNATSLSHPQHLEEYSVFEGDWTGRHANRASRVRLRHRRQESSDEDFEVDMERILENSSIANEGLIASRPVTRAMDQVSDLGERGQLSDSFVHETRGFTVNLDALQSGAGGTSLQIRDPQDVHARRGSSVTIDEEIDKRKGKEKALEAEESTANVADEESTTVVCGICWTEMVAVERGKLDSCDHFFCFGCIMEWAKVESRCPMCKQRFTTIARSGSGFSKRIRTIRIPLRNQVYIPPEDPDLPLEDPYADIVCMECQGTGDEGLLLLCDRCDSAAHTFCVGLGRSVPRGDWYCRDCQALRGGMSGSEDEPEELGLASGDDVDDNDDDTESENDDTDSLLRSIVASVNPGSQRTRRARVQRTRRSTSTTSSLPLRRNVRRRLRQRLFHRHRGRHIAPPRLSQTVRALLSSTSELNQAPHTPEASQNGSARTVPQQRRLHERINEMRINWGRIQNGDLHFDALGIGAAGPMQQAVPSNLNGAASRTGATGPAQVAVSSNSNIAPIAASTSIMSSVSDKTDVDFIERPESSTQGEKDVERAWRMMGHAQNLTAGIDNSKSHQQKLGAPPSSSVLARATQPTVNTTSSATSNFIPVRTNLEIPTCNVPSPPPKNGNAGIYKPGSTSVQVFPNLKHDEIPLRQLPRPIVPLASTGECRKEELPSSSNSKQTLTACKSPIGFDKDSSRPAGGKHTVNFAILQGFKPDLSNSGRQFERKDAGITRTVSRDVSAARENIVAGSLSSPPHEGLKVHLTELVKRQTWPVYITERLDKEQFKRIARAAVHSLLALCDPNNKSMSLSCVHFEDQGNDPVVKCCNKCLDHHVEKAVKNAKDKVIPS